jgi:DNA replication protein DnaC
LCRLVPGAAALEKASDQIADASDSERLPNVKTEQYVSVPPGVGKSHFAVALGMKACEQGVRTLFITATALIATLSKALAEGCLEERLNIVSQPQLLIIDEIGYLPIDRQGASLFFQLVSRRYERGSIIITSNQSLGAWGDLLSFWKHAWPWG